MNTAFGLCCIIVYVIRRAYGLYSLVRLFILVPPEQPIITGPEPAITTALNAGSTYQYVCTARNGRPAPAIRWKLGTAISSAIEIHQGIAENTTTNSDSTLSKTTSLSWVPITDDDGKNLYCQTNQTIAGGHTTQRSTFVSIVVQGKSNDIEFPRSQTQGRDTFV